MCACCTRSIWCIPHSQFKKLSHTHLYFYLDVFSTKKKHTIIINPQLVSIIRVGYGNSQKIWWKKIIRRLGGRAHFSSSNLYAYARSSRKGYILFECALWALFAQLTLKNAQNYLAIYLKWLKTVFVVWDREQNLEMR